MSLAVAVEDAKPVGSVEVMPGLTPRARSESGGGVKVTCRFFTPTLFASRTWTIKVSGKTVLIWVLWFPPERTRTCVAGPLVDSYTAMCWGSGPCITKFAALVVVEVAGGQRLRLGARSDGLVEHERCDCSAGGAPRP